MTNSLCGDDPSQTQGCQTQGRTGLCRAGCGGGDGALARPSRRRAEDVAKDRRGLWPRCQAIPDVSRRALWRGAVTEETGGTCTAGRAGLHGGTAGGRHRKPVADAGTRRRPVICAVSRAERQGQGRRAQRRAGAEGRENIAETAAHCGGETGLGRGSARRRGARTVGARARCRGARTALRLGLADFRGARTCSRAASPRPDRATPSP